MTPDPRIRDYARLLVEQCVDVQPGWQVLLAGSCLSRPLTDEIARLLARKGANESAIHWDIVKDLREGGRIELDGEVVQEDGKWLIGRS